MSIDSVLGGRPWGTDRARFQRTVLWTGFRLCRRAVDDQNGRGCSPCQSGHQHHAGGHTGVTEQHDADAGCKHLDLFRPKPGSSWRSLPPLPCGQGRLPPSARAHRAQTAGLASCSLRLVLVAEGTWFSNPLPAVDTCRGVKSTSSSLRRAAPSHCQWASIRHAHRHRFRASGEQMA